MVSALFSTIGCFVANLLVRDRLKKTVESYIVEKRMNSISEQSIVRRKYQGRYSALHQPKNIQKKEQQIYEFPAARTRMAYSFMRAGIVIALFSIIVLKATGEYLITYINIGGGVFLIGILLRILLRGTVYLAADKLTFKRQKILTDSIDSIWIHPSERKFFLTLDILYNQPIVFKIPKGYRKDAISILEKWCADNNVMNIDQKSIPLRFRISIGFYLVLSVLLVLIVFG